MCEMGEIDHKDIISSLRDSSRHEDKRFEDMTIALRWLTSQLKILKDQDRTLMRKFLQIREQINDIKEEQNLQDSSIIYEEETEREEEEEELSDDESTARRRDFSEPQITERADADITIVTFPQEY